MECPTARDDVAARARALLKAHPAKATLVKGNAKKRRREVALLPQQSCLPQLEAHPIVQTSGVEPLAVYRVLERLLCDADAQAGKAPSAHASERASCPKVPCGNCGCEVDTRGVDRKDFIVCPACGVVVEGRNLWVTNPYREFEDKPSRVHFDIPTRPSEHVEAVAQLAMHAQLPYAYIAPASALLRRHPHAGEAFVAATAALVAVHMDYDQGAGRLTERAVTSFTCAHCGAATGSRRAARFHCRGGRSTLEQTALTRDAQPLRRRA